MFISVSKFQQFELTHWVALTCTILVIFFIYLYKENLYRNEKIVRTILIVGLLFGLISYQIFELYNGSWSIKRALPFQLCDISAILCIALIITKKEWIYRIVFFTGLGGATQGILTPNLVYDFPHVRFFDFFIMHTFIIFTVLFFNATQKYRPTIKSIWITFGLLNLLLPFILWINNITGGNYMFLSRKPSTSSILDYLGPYPYYIFILEFLIVIVFILLYLPYLIKDYRKNSMAKE